MFHTCCCYLGLESGQHVEIRLLCGIVLDSRVVNTFRIYQIVLLVWSRAWSTCWDSIEMFNQIGFESGEQIEIALVCSIIRDSRVVNM